MKHFISRFMLMLMPGIIIGVTAARAYQPVPLDGKITLTDYGYRDWGPELVHYTVDPAKFRPGGCVLTDANGLEVPCQIDGNTLTFVGVLPKGKTVTYRLTPGHPSPAMTELTVKHGDTALEVGNNCYTLRLPPVGKHRYRQPITAADTLPPILQWRVGGSPWMGGAHFVTARKVSNIAFTLLRNGPACVEYEARYQFAPAGAYVCRITVAPGLDRAEFVEEFDFGGITRGQDFLLLELQKNCPATTVDLCSGDDGVLSHTPLQNYLAEKLSNNTNATANVGGAGRTPMPPIPESGMVLLDKIYSASHWGDLKGGVGLSTAGDAPWHVGVVPMHAGSWRRAMALMVWHNTQDGMDVSLPISVRPLTWYNETTDDISPFSTGEPDPGLKPTYGRRQWALYFGDSLHMLQRTVGYIGLDTYKEWVLDWPDTTPASAYPRVWYTRDQVNRLKNTLDHHPDKAIFSQYYVFSGNPDDAIRHANEAITSINDMVAYQHNWNEPTIANYRQAQLLSPGAQLVDDALACPQLPAKLRVQLRRMMATYAYLISNPDFNPRGSAAHMGNDTMPIDRTCPVLAFAGLIPDHPLYKYWMDQGTAYVKYKLATYVAPDGVTKECPTYALSGGIRFLDDAVAIIRNTGGPDLGKLVAPTARYLANLTMPDPRYDGFRCIPGMGNSGNMLDGYFAMVMADVEKTDAKLAGQLQTLYQHDWPTEPLGKRLYQHQGMAFRYYPDVPANDLPLTTTVMPTYGVVFRAHYNTPEETAMLFRIGTNSGHWDTDALNTILYGKGAPLSPGTGYQYVDGSFSALTADQAIYHNRVKVGKYDTQEVFGRVDNVLLDYGFGPDADYAVGSRYLPAQIFDDQGGETSWNRHVLFLKSPRPSGPNYFVLRDTFPGNTARPNWWTWLNLEGADKISVDGVAFAREDAPYNKRLPEAQVPARTGNIVEMKTVFGASTWFWFADARPFRARLTTNYSVADAARLGLSESAFPKMPSREMKTLLEGAGQPGQEWFYVVYPRKDGEEVPSVSKLADGVLKVVTHESTDYVFESDTPLNFNRDGVVFTGKAGAVRVFNDHVVLCLNAGNGKIGYQGYVLSGSGAFERTVRLAELKSGETKVNDTYEKVWQTIEIGDGLTVRGEQPFSAKQIGKSIRISTDGRARVIYVTKPSWTNWVQYWMDGQEYMACWTDYPASGWGTYTDTKLIALTVPDGKHELVVKDFTYPAVWTREFTPAIQGVQVQP